MTSAVDGARIRFGPGGGCFFCRSVHPVVSEVEAVASRTRERVCGQDMGWSGRWCESESESESACV
jgi:hypothetical protein